MFRQPPFSMAWSRRVTTPIVHTAQGAPQAATVARLEQALSTAMAHYLMDRHQGRIDPKKSSATSTHCARPLTRRPTCIRRWRPGVPLADLHKAALSLRVRGGAWAFTRASVCPYRYGPGVQRVKRANAPKPRRS